MAKTVYEVLMQVAGGQAFRGDLEAAERQVNLVVQAAEAVGPALSNAGTTMLEFSDRAARANADMERGLTNLQVIMGATAEEVGAYNDSLDGVLERTNFQISRNDALTSSYDAASAGFTESADAIGLLENSMNLAIAGTSGLDQATDNLQDSQRAVIVGLKNYESELSQYGDTTAQAARVSDLLNRTIELGITDISQLAPQFAEIAPTAAAAGVGIEELSAAYAAATSTGVGTAQVTTGVKAALDAISRGGASAEAKKLIEETGIAFSAQALEAEGLTGILKDLEAANLTTLDSLLKLTGSTEAAAFLANLTGDLDRTLETFDQFNGELNSTADIAAVKAEDKLAQLTAATNRFDDALAKAGENLAPINSQLLDLGAGVLDAFNGLPESLQSVIGSIVVIGGGAARAGGDVIQLASNIAVARIAYTQWAAQMGITNGLLSVQAVKAKAAAGAQALLNVQLGATVTGLAAVAATAATAAAAVGAVTLAYKQYQNIREQERNQEQLGDLQETEILAQRVSTLVLKMRETGEAIPDQEFREWNTLLEQANENNGTLTGVIEAFNNVQERAKNGTLEKAKATEKENQATVAAIDSTAKKIGVEEDAAAAAEKAAAAQEAQAQAAKAAEAANAQLLETLKQGLSGLEATVSASELALETAIDQGTTTTREAYEERTRLLQLQVDSTRNLYQQALNSEALAEGERGRLLQQQQQQLQQLQRERLQLQRQQAQELSGINAEAREREMLALEAKADRELWTETEKTEAIRALRERQLQATIATAETELATVVEGSARQRELVLEKMRAEAALASSQAQTRREQQAAQNRALEERRVAEVRAAEESKRRAEQVAQALKDQWKRETAAYLQTLDERVSAATNAGNRISRALETRSQVGGIASSVLSDFGGTLDARNQARERAADIVAQIAELEAEALETGESRRAQIQDLQGQLERQHQIQNLTNVELGNSQALLAEMGVVVDRNLGAGQAEFQLVQQQLAIKNDQLQIELQQERIKIRLKQLEQDRLILELQRKATAEDISDTEARNLRMQIQNAQAAKALLDEQLRASEQLTGLQQAANTQSARNDLAAQGIDPKELGKEFKAANTELGDQLTGSLNELKEATSSQGSKIAESVGAQAEAIQGSLNQVGAGIPSAVDPVVRGIRDNAGIQERGFGAALAATQAQTQELASQLAALQRVTAAIPGQLASLMPRPEPRSRD